MKNSFIDHYALTNKAIKKINTLGGQSLIVVKNKNIFKGILSSFDLRKAIMNKNILNKNINKVYNKKAKFIFLDQLQDKIAETQLNVKRLGVIPVIDRKTHKVVQILRSSNLNSLKIKNSKKINCDVIIMAGGKGVRLRPYTDVLPKPLLPINKKPAIRHILEKFSNYQPSKFYITVNYKSELLKSYFEESKTQFNIQLINEDKPLGTAGSLFFLKKKIKKYFFLTNCDTIINSNYHNILQYHLKNKNDITVVVAKKTFTIPYGVSDPKNKGTFALTEKPKIKFNVNVGTYVINKDILKQIKSKKYLDFTSLIDLSVKNKKKIGQFEIKDKDWIDVGQMDKYKYFLNKKI
tara:strand:- start:198 stop:1247 length:1050 start_codon:yes stop_codon:yes gene_type:complete